MRRQHDDELAALVASAANGRSRMAVLVGSSATFFWKATHQYITHAEDLSVLADAAPVG
ncbi:hypothetical protein [Streptomyces sp. NPDC007905]|uniref:hypothetical protein n=1 Tax=Streptomyces sp. NPDC007905 TaxID=3364788 RepID=UPI0036E8C7ED